jgi:hypothetical protein
MDAQRSFSKQASALRNIPSINDFNTLTNREDLESDSSFSSGVVSRSWSMESTETPHKYVKPHYTHASSVLGRLWGLDGPPTV